MSIRFGKHNTDLLKDTEMEYPVFPGSYYPKESPHQRTERRMRLISMLLPYCGDYEDVPAAILKYEETLFNDK